MEHSHFKCRKTNFKVAEIAGKAGKFCGKYHLRIRKFRAKFHFKVRKLHLKLRKVLFKRGLEKNDKNKNGIIF